MPTPLGPLTLQGEGVDFRNVFNRKCCYLPTLGAHYANRFYLITSNAIVIICLLAVKVFGRGKRI